MPPSFYTTAPWMRQEDKESLSRKLTKTSKPSWVDNKPAVRGKQAGPTGYAGQSDKQRAQKTRDIMKWVNPELHQALGILRPPSPPPSRPASPSPPPHSRPASPSPPPSRSASPSPRPSRSASQSDDEDKGDRGRRRRPHRPRSASLSPPRSRSASPSNGGRGKRPRRPRSASPGGRSRHDGDDDDEDRYDLTGHWRHPFPPGDRAAEPASPLPGGAAEPASDSRHDLTGLGGDPIPPGDRAAEPSTPPPDDAGSADGDNKHALTGLGGEPFPPADRAAEPVESSVDPVLAWASDEIGHKDRQIRELEQNLENAADQMLQLDSVWRHEDLKNKGEINRLRKQLAAGSSASEQERAQAKEKLRLLEASRADKVKEAQEARQKVDGLSEQLRQAKEQLETEQKQQGQLTRQVQDLQKRLDEQEGKLKAATEADNKQAAQQARAEIEELQKQLQAQQAATQGLQQQLQEQVRQADEKLRRALAAKDAGQEARARAAKQQWEERLAQASAEAEKQKDERQAQEAAHAAALAEVARLEAEHKQEFENTVAGLNSRVASLNGELRGARERAQALELEKEQKEQQRQRAETEKLRLLELTQKMQKTLDNHKTTFLRKLAEAKEQAGMVIGQIREEHKQRDQEREQRLIAISQQLQNKAVGVEQREQLVNQAAQEMQTRQQELARKEQNIVDVQQQVQEWYDRAAAENQELRQTAASAEADKQAVQADMQQLQAEHGQTKQALAQAQAEAAALETEVQKIRDEAKTDKERHDQTEQLLEQYRLRLGDVQRELDRANQEKTELGSANKDLVAELHRTQNEVAATSEEAARLDRKRIAQARAAQAALTKLKQQMREQEAKIQEQDQQINLVEGERKRAEEEVRAAQETARDEKQKAALIRERIKRMESGHEESMAEATEAYLASESKVAELAKKLSAQKGQVTKLKRQAEAAEQALRDAEMEHGRREERSADETKRATKLANLRRTLYEKAKARLDEQVQQQQAVEKQLQESQLHTNQLETELSSKDQRIADLLQRSKAQEEMLRRVQEKEEAAVEQLNRLQQGSGAVETKLKELEQERDEKQAKIRELEAALLEKDAFIDSGIAERHKATEQLDKQDNMIAESLTAMHEMEEQLAEKDAEIEKMRKAYNRLVGQKNKAVLQASKTDSKKLKDAQKRADDMGKKKGLLQREVKRLGSLLSAATAKVTSVVSAAVGGGEVERMRGEMEELRKRAEAAEKKAQESEAKLKNYAEPLREYMIAHQERDFLAMQRFALREGLGNKKDNIRDEELVNRALAIHITSYLNNNLRAAVDRLAGNRRYNTVEERMLAAGTELANSFAAHKEVMGNALDDGKVMAEFTSQVRERVAHELSSGERATVEPEAAVSRPSKRARTDKEEETEKQEEAPPDDESGKKKKKKKEKNIKRTSRRHKPY